MVCIEKVILQIKVFTYFVSIQKLVNFHQQLVHLNEFVLLHNVFLCKGLYAYKGVGDPNVGDKFKYFCQFLFDTFLGFFRGFQYILYRGAFHLDYQAYIQVLFGQYAELPEKELGHFLE